MFRILGMCPVLKGLKIMLMYKQPTNFKMLVFLFVKGREGPGEL